MRTATFHPHSVRVELKPHKLPGALITFSGCDGSGKSTTINLVRRYLRSRGIVCVTVNSLSKECRKLPYFRTYVADPVSAIKGTVNLPALCLVCLGDRLMTVRTRVIPLLGKGVWVLQDRYLYTSLAELLVTRCTKEDMEAVKHAASRFPSPDLAVLTTVRADEVVRRIRRRPKERDSAPDAEFFMPLVQAYNQVAEDNGLVILRTNRSRESAFENLRPRLDRLIKARNLT